MPRNKCPCKRQPQSSTGRIQSSHHSITESTTINESIVLCPACIDHALRIPLERQRQAIDERNKKREWCDRRLIELREERKSRVIKQPGENPGRVDAATIDDKDLICHGGGQTTTSTSSQTLNDLQNRLTHLRKLRHDTKLTLTNLQISNDERSSKLNQNNNLFSNANSTIHNIYNDVILTEMQNAISTNIHQIRRLRFQLAQRIFKAHKLDVGSDHLKSQTTTLFPKRKIPTGIGKIGGLVLPHAGPALYGALPPPVLSSALRLVASLTGTLARCLGVRLPHPILLMDDDGDVVDDDIAMSNDTSSSLLDRRRHHQRLNCHFSSSPRRRGDRHAAPNEFSIGKKVRHASDAVLRESPESRGDVSVNSSAYDLRPPPLVGSTDEETRDDQENFAIGLQLLQNDVVALCIRVGVDVECLWPAEAVLLNLGELEMFCGKGSGGVVGDVRREF